MSVAEIIKNKNQETYTCRKDWSVLKCIHLMNEKKIGALVVTDEENMVEGILTERDVLRLIGECNCIPENRTAEEIMTSKDTILTAKAEASVEEVMNLMTENRIRHLPLIEDGKLIGIVSIGDTVKFMLDEAMFENSSMRSYISGM